MKGVQMKTLKVRQKIETLLDFPVIWQQCYSWFQELLKGDSMMEECSTMAQQPCKDGGPPFNMHQRGAAFCHSFFK
jgi:hypothetical protein